MARAQGGHRVPREHQINLLGKLVRVQHIAVVLQQNAAGAGRDPRQTDAGQPCQLRGDFAALFLQIFQPRCGQPQTAGQIVHHVALHQFFLIDVSNHTYPSFCCGSRRIRRLRTSASSSDSSASFHRSSFEIRIPSSTTMSTHFRMARDEVISVS